MANTNQHLKHGKALCGAVFAGFVETFNALVDFMCNVRGDADIKNGEGHISIDRTNPLHPVIRFVNNEKDDSTHASAILPWTFSCTEDDAGNRSGGWRNCRLQIGYNRWLVSPDLNTPYMLSGVAEIGGTDRTDDGFYVVEVDVSNETAVIMLRSEISHRYPVDPEASVVYVDIGQVKDGVQKTRIPCNPVVYKYV